MYKQKLCLGLMASLPEPLTEQVRMIKSAGFDAVFAEWNGKGSLDEIADWDNIAARLDKWGYNGILTFELTVKSKPDRHENDKYAAMPTESYLAEAYSRACRVVAKRKSV